MINHMTKYKTCIILAIMALSVLMADAKTASGSNGEISIEYEEMADGGIKVVNVRNKSDKKITLSIDSKTIDVKANSSARPNRYARKRVKYDFATVSGETLWKYVEPKKEAPEAPAEEKKEQPKAGRTHAEKPVAAEREVRTSAPTTTYFDKMNQDPFFGLDAVNAYSHKINALCTGLTGAKDKGQFIIDHDVMEVLKQSKQEIELKRSEIPLFAQELVSGAGMNNANQSNTLNLIIETLTGRLRSREEAYTKLENLVSDIDTEETISHDSDEMIVNYAIVGTVVILVILLVIIALRKKNNRKSGKASSASGQIPMKESTADNPAIVVRRRTTSILKKQCIDDVIDNPAYLKINTADFTANSAVNNIYIKNTCIKEVYNMYAEDLRNSENPKEDGCMVLGRWVCNDASRTYDISLEEVIYPGDDAVFKEYELNFGGKIKLRIAEKLRKLRRETNLQYDLVCWIHSHPGLGVFFSNSDDNVQMQLKHSQHPNFLIAFVVDILTSNQEMGIFTFRKDGSMNSKGDITKMYSLEEMYKWALQSERDSFSHDNYFNVLGNARLTMPACKGVELNNSSIIDLTQIVIEENTGIIGWAVGSMMESGAAREFVVSGIVKDSKKPTAGIIGCLISMGYMSLPTIQRLVANDIRDLSFVLVYSSKQMTLTAIPVINGELLTDEQFYSDVTIDELKIWTRRKR